MSDEPVSQRSDRLTNFIPSPWPIFLGFQALILGLGLIAPLTPSEGRPSAVMVLFWVGSPLLILWLSVRRYPSPWLRVFVAAQAMLMLGLTWVLVLSLG